MKYIIFFIISFWSQFIFGQFKETNKALIFIDSLKTEKIKSSNQFNVIPNSYSLIDLNNDAVFEVIEITNKIEDDIPGFLPIELSSAFEYHKIYSLKGNTYEPSNDNFTFYQDKQKNI